MRGTVAAAVAAMAAAVGPLHSFPLSGVTTSGISAGAFMASQFHVAYSSIVSGAALLAGGPYYCAQGEEAYALTQCMSSPNINVNSLIGYAQLMADVGSIDPLGNLNASRVWFFSAYQDSVVNTGVVQAAQQFYAHWVPAANSTFLQRDGEHTQQTLNYGNPCSTLGSPYIGKCDFDAAGSQLQWLYSNTLTPPSQAQRDAITADAEAAVPAMAAARTAGTAGHSWSVGAGVMSSFDQSIFVNASAPMGTGVGPTGYIYVPAGCNATAGGTASCRLHISWHGCNQGAGAIGETFVLNGGYLPWADANNIVVLFPQAATTLENPEGCWDWWGYTTSSYATKTGVQPSAVYNMAAFFAGL